MIFSKVSEFARLNPQRDLIRGAGGPLSYGEAVESVRKVAGGLAQREESRWMVKMLDSSELVMTLLAIDAVGGEACVLNSEETPKGILNIGERIEFENLIGTDAGYDDGLSRLNFKSLAAAGPDEELITDTGSGGSILILTTGTTGVPKAARYSWSRLAGPVRTGERFAGGKWLLTYRLNHFAGIQVLLHVIMNSGTLIIPQSLDVDSVVESMIEHQVEYLSGTPTFWRLFTGLVDKGVASKISVKHLTIGGEAVTEDILGRLKDLFPGVPVTQMYVTTELGVCFVVRDGKKGFPLAFLKDESIPVEIDIREGELFVRSPHGMEKYYGGADSNSEGWFATGDMVDIVGDRVYFMGRRSEIINVGGRKVHPQEIEEVVQKVAEVRAVRVYGLKNPITGQIVAMDVELFPDSEPEKVKELIEEVCIAALDRYKQPRTVNVVESIPQANLKILRRRDT